MPSTRELITIIQDDYLPDVSRPKILNYIDKAQRALFNVDCAQTVWKMRGDTIEYPYLSTTTGILDYDIDETTLVDSNGDTISIQVGGYDVAVRRVARVFTVDEKFEYPVVVSLYDRTNLEPARVVFAVDPGTYPDKYFVEFYYSPMPLETEFSVLTIDADKWEQALIDGAVGYYEDLQNGVSQRFEKFQTYWMKKFKEQSNSKLDKRYNLQIPVRRCG